MKLKRNIIILVLLFNCINGFGQTKVMSLNIRYDNPNDGVNWWENRKEEVVQLIDFYHPEFLGIQEGLSNQLEFIVDKLNGYNYIGVGRDDGKQQGEFAAIIFDSTKFKLIETKTFWLSQTPDTVSVGWDASMERISTYGAFINKNTKDSIFIFNCHFDHIGKISRKMSSELILKKINEFGLNESRLIVMGDLNCESQDEPIQVLRQELDDAVEISEKPHYGPHGTFSGFDNNLIIKKRIDYILTKNLRIKNYRHVDDRRKNNLYISDHLPVLVEIIETTGNNAYTQ